MIKMSRIQFDVQATLQQEVVIIKEELTPEQLVEGLNTGTYLTTIAYDNTSNQVSTVCEVDDDGNEITIANILSQSTDDESYSNFELKPTE